MPIRNLLSFAESVDSSGQVPSWMTEMTTTTTTTTTTKGRSFSNNKNPSIYSLPSFGSAHSQEYYSKHSSPWSLQSTTPVTFTFEIGLPHTQLQSPLPNKINNNNNNDQQEPYEHLVLSLRGKSIKFTYGQAHDCLVLDGNPIGDPTGGDNFPNVTRISRSDNIRALTLGLSDYSGEAAFHGALLSSSKTKSSRKHAWFFNKYNPLVCLFQHENHHHQQTDKHNNNKKRRKKNHHRIKRILVGAQLQGPTWTYDREKLGLNLWLTSVCAPKERPVGRYGFTLSSDPHLTFNPQEFQLFWNWLVDIKHQIIINNNHPTPCSRSSFIQKVQQKQEEEEEDSPLLQQQQLQLEQQKEQANDNSVFNQKHQLSRQQVEERMRPLYEYYSTSFAGEHEPAATRDGWMYGTAWHINIVYDVFSLTLYRLPDEESYKVILFVDGVQYDPEKYTSVESIPLHRNYILAYAIATAAQDQDLLYQMGLVGNERDDDSLVCLEREVLYLRKSPTLFKGNLRHNPMARKVMAILAMAGLRMAGSTILVDDLLGWDIYSFASFHPDNQSEWIHRALFFASFICFLIQVFVPALLIYRALFEETFELEWDTYITRILFLLYAILSEYKTLDIDREDRIDGWLCFFPEVSSLQVIFGRTVNNLSKLVTTAAQVGLILTSFTVLDVTLNSLALFYLVELDDVLLNSSALDFVRRYNAARFLRIKSEVALRYRKANFRDDDEPEIQEMPAKYFLLLSRQIGRTCIVILFLALLYVTVSPWIYRGANNGGFAE